MSILTRATLHGRRVLIWSDRRGEWWWCSVEGETRGPFGDAREAYEAVMTIRESRP